jgi:hypothetical protein
MTNPFELFLPGDYVRMIFTIEDRYNEGDICQYLERTKAGYRLYSITNEEVFECLRPHFVHVDNRLSDLSLEQHICHRIETINKLTEGVKSLKLADLYNALA